MNGLEAERKTAVDDIEKLQKQLQDQINFFQKVYQELDSKKQDLNDTFQASVQYLKKEIADQEQ